MITNSNQSIKSALREKSAKSEAGFALITVLFIVALIAMITTGLIYQQGVQIQRSSYLLHQSQGQAVILGLVHWVKAGLKLDLQNNQVDHLGEQWAQPLPPVPFAGGEVSGRLWDLNGRLNVNNLVLAKPASRQLWHQVWQRYATEQWQQPEVVNAMQDWVDADETPQEEGGGESDVYLLKMPPYRASNRPIVQLSELLLVQGIRADKLWQSRTDMTALPTATRINVNTAPAKVLLALSDLLTPELAKKWLEKRQQSPAQQTGDFRDFVRAETGAEAQKVNEALPEALIGVQSQYFLLEGAVKYGDSEQYESAIFYRPNKQTVTLWMRWQTPAPAPIIEIKSTEK